MFAKHPLSSAIALSAGLATGLATLPAQAQMLEEVIVTATKRAVGMQDVPIALAVMGAEKISEQGIGSLADIAVFMPNVHIAEASAGDQLFIRGIGSGVNYGFEQSVGTFIDGVYFGRGQASRSAFMDLERVEVLKGSQSTLFGKNTIAGAINITSAKPGDEFEGSIEANYEPEFDGKAATLIVSGPITDTFGARLALRSDETDGWMSNNFIGENEVSKDDKIGRLTLSWQPTADLDVSLKYEKGESEATGSNEVISITTPTSDAIYTAVDPNFAQNSGFGYDKSDATFGGIRGGETFHDSEWDITTLTVEWALGEYVIKSITGYVDYQFENYRDSDYSALKAIARGRDEQHQQFTQEFLLTSPPSDTFEYLAGLYYQDEQLEHDRFTDVSLSSLVDAGIQFIVNGNDQTALVGTGIADASGVNTFNQDAQTLSAFAQGTWHFTDSLRLIAGLRYSEDEKEFDKSGDTAALFTDGPHDDLLAAIYDKTLNLATVHFFKDGVAEVCPATDRDLPGLSTTTTCVISAISTKEDESHWTGDITLQWDVNEDATLYAKYGNGYKAGGFDEDNGRGLIEAAHYDDETSDTFEIGLKTDLWDSRGRLNVAVFHSEYQDVQVSTFDGNAGFVVGNAAETEVDGLELDAMFAVTDELTVYGGAAWLDATYKSFPNAGCNNEQITAFLAAGGEVADCVQDLSGEPLQFSAELSGNLGATYRKAITDKVEVSLSTDLMYSDDYDTAADIDSNLKQDSFTKLNARVGFADVEGVWSIALLGKNLTDENTSTWGNDIPLGSFGFAGSYFQIIDAPRSFEIQAKYNFY